MWVLDFVQERFHNTSPGDFESTFIKARDSEIKEGLRVEEATRERMSEKKEALETGSGGQPKMSCHCPLLPWLQVS